jgi:hypothetical protein
VIRIQGPDNIMAQVIEPTNDVGYMVEKRIEPVFASPGASIYGQVILATVLPHPYGVSSVSIKKISGEYVHTEVF